MMSSSERNRQVKMIRMQYEELSQKWGYNADDLFKRFQKRLEEAKINKAKLRVFFAAEKEAIKIFEDRIKNYVEGNEAAPAEQLLAEEGAMDANTASSASQRSSLYQVIKESGSPSVVAYRGYPRVGIHKNASSEMEHLFGAMVDFRLSVIPVLEETRQSIRDKSYHTMTYEIENLLNEVGDDDHGKLPAIFSVYKNKIERARSSDEAGHARIEPFKAIVNINRKITRLERWIENHQAKLPPQVNINYGDDHHSIRALGKALARDMDRIIKSFGLQNVSY